MAESQRSHVVATILDQKISAIIRTNDQRTAHDAMTAAVEGGFRLVEFTLTTPGALELVATFARRNGITVGAGTVLSRVQAREAVAAGARFLVSPICDPEVIAEAAVLDVACIPGTYTPTEMQTAYRHGADFVKVFPEPAGGPEYVHAIRGPLPHLRLFPTAGPTPDNFLAYLEAGSAGVGFVRSLFRPDELSAGDFRPIRERASLIARRLAEWSQRGKREPVH